MYHITFNINDLIESTTLTVAQMLLIKLDVF